MHSGSRDRSGVSTATGLVRRVQPRDEQAWQTLIPLHFAELADPFHDESLEPADRSENSRLVRRALTLIECEFETRTWRAFWMAAVDELSTAEIAERLEISTAAVRQASRVCCADYSPS